MIYLNAIIVAVIEGITEFLPISSTGHMILVENHMTLGDESFARSFMILIQLPAILAVVLFFLPMLWPFGKGKPIRDATIALWIKVVIAFMPAAIIGLIAKDYVREKLFNPVTVALALIVGGIVLIILEWKKQAIRFDTTGRMSYAVALAIGCFQCLALCPGVSRSASTIIGALLLGASRTAATEFSFFLAIPTMLGATTLELLDSGASFTTNQCVLLALGSVVSFATAWAVVAFLMRFIRTHDFKVFGYYRIILGVIVLLFS